MSQLPFTILEKAHSCGLLDSNNFEGIVKGEILDKKKGDKGFGYDPVFLPDGYDQSFAELPRNEKNEISHRARALKKLNKFLNDK